MKGGLGLETGGEGGRQPLSRRGFLAGAAAAGGLALLGDLARAWAAESPDPGFAGGTLLGTLPFLLEPDEPLGTRFGEGLDARLYTDLGSLDPERPSTPLEKFFLRTGAPSGLAAAGLSTLRLGGRVREARQVAVAELAAAADERGVEVVECAGNGRWTRFGLISAGRWAGVPLARVLDRVTPLPGAAALRVSGLDDHSPGSTDSTPGCDWIFSLDQLAAAGAFLATRLDGRELTADHGAPLRLAVSGWYGCCWIKWVTALDLVGSDEPATSQMKEFAVRTHQGGVPERAADYAPAIVDAAALPVRVERWRVAGSDRYRVVGLAWGGAGAPPALGIRFRPDAPFLPLDRQPVRAPAGGFAWWSHAWQPPAPGRYLVQLAVADPAVSARRLAGGFYVRAIEVPADSRLPAAPSP